MPPHNAEMHLIIISGLLDVLHQFSLLLMITLDLIMTMGTSFQMIFTICTIVNVSFSK